MTGRRVATLLLACALSAAVPAAAAAEEGRGARSADLAERFDFSFLGADPDDQMGVQVRLGDLNGDGLDELVLGAWLGDGPRNNRINCGEIYVFYGRPVGDLPGESFDVSVLYGANPGDRIGSCVDTGDFNGDALPDLAVGARYSGGHPDSLRPRCGEAFLLLGGSSGSRMEHVDARRDPDLVIYGREPGDRLGRRILIHDMDGDGKKDLLLAAVGSSGRRGDETDAGAVYFVYGDRREDLDGIIDLAIDEVPVLHGEDQSDGLGGAMAVGDWNGDGAPDLVLGCGFADGPANSRTNAGETFVLFGRPGVRFRGEKVVEEGKNLTIYGGDAYDATGVSVAMGDMDGDGVDDLAIGANLADGPENERDNCGGVYVLFGHRAPPDSPSIDLAEGADVTVHGEAPGDQAGSLIDLFDWSGDGFGDLIVVSMLHDGPAAGRLDAGMVYAILGGRQSNLRPRYDFAADEADLRLLGPTVNDRIASALGRSRLGGRPLLILSTMRGDGPMDERRDAGEVFFLPWDPPRRTTPLDP
ncbi:MAG: FG-GAP repeat protein [Candidatus Eisenbacteria bacterium]|nr:FG-GAP repeat protein [Candidatus Eisenbacteria bacterium]